MIWLTLFAAVLIVVAFCVGFLLGDLHGFYDGSTREREEKAGRKPGPRLFG